jgi:hypothetical protein
VEDRGGQDQGERPRSSWAPLVDPADSGPADYVPYAAYIPYSAYATPGTAQLAGPSGRRPVARSVPRNVVALVVLWAGLVAMTAVQNTSWATNLGGHQARLFYLGTWAVPVLVAAVVTSADLVGRLILAAAVLVAAVVLFALWPPAGTAWHYLGYPLAFAIVLAGWIAMKARPVASYVVLAPYLVVASLVDVPKGIGRWFAAIPEHHLANAYSPGLTPGRFAANLWWDADIWTAGVLGLVAALIAIGLAAPSAVVPLTAPRGGR